MSTQHQRPGSDPNLQVVWWCHGCANCKHEDGTPRAHKLPCSDSPSLSGALVRFVSASWGSPERPAARDGEASIDPIQVAVDGLACADGLQDAIADGTITRPHLREIAENARRRIHAGLRALYGLQTAVATPAPEGDTEPPCESVEVRRWDGSASGLRELADWAGNDPTGEPQFSWLRIGNQNGGDFHAPMLGEMGVKPGDLFAKVSGWVLPAEQPEGDTEEPDGTTGGELLIHPGLDAWVAPERQVEVLPVLAPNTAVTVAADGDGNTRFVRVTISGHEVDESVTLTGAEAIKIANALKSAEPGDTETVTRTVHTVYVPPGWEPEQVWERIASGKLVDAVPGGGWAVLEIDGGGKIGDRWSGGDLVRVVPADDDPEGGQR